MKPNLTLRKAIDEAYAAFAVYPPPLEMIGSPYENVEGIFKSLTAAPLRDLTGDQIGPYCGSAILTVGSVADYKHFLPRVLEQAVLQPEWVGTEGPIIAQRLERARWLEWPRREQGAVRDVFREAWLQSIAEHPLENGGQAEDWLCGIAALGEPITPLLAAWLANPSANTVLSMAWIGMSARQLLSQSPHELVFWADVDSSYRHELFSWLSSQAVVEKFRSALEQVAIDDRWVLNRALDALAGYSHQ